MHLRFNIYGSPNGHPQQVMKELGITYQHATPQSIGDQWWFWNCQNVPDPLPDYITVLDVTPSDAIGFGLNKEDAIRIESYEGFVTEKDVSRIVSNGSSKSIPFTPPK